MKLIMRKARLKKQLWLRVLLVTGLVFGLFGQPAFVRAQEWATSGSNIYNMNTGNVGIGTASPTAPLHVSSNLDGSNVVHLYNYNANSYGPYIQAGGGSLGKYMLYVADYSGSGKFIVDGNGNVGIGPVSPGAILHLQKTSGNTKLMIDNTVSGGQSELYMNSNASPWVLFTQDNYRNGNLILNTSENFSTSIMEITRTGNVGIGTTSPAAPLHLDRTNSIGAVNNTNVMTGAALRIGGTQQWAGQILIGSSEGSNYFWYQTGKWDAANGVLNPYYALAINPLGGNVGIGTTTPSATLDVVGNATFSGTVTGGNIQAKYQDVAEWVPASSAISPGTVVILDMEHSNQVVFSSNAYDTRVAGVVSATPGLLLGEAGEGKVKVATTGRVKVKVDATREPIRVGDLLVTSDQEGMAMRSEPLDFGGIPIHRPGTILGKALESLSEGKGEILVLLTLQ